MPKLTPVLASGKRPPLKGNRIPPPVRLAVQYMVEGTPDAADDAPIDFIEAAKMAGIKPDQMRRWLDVPAVRALIKDSRIAYRTALCAANEQVLGRIRDRADNSMARVRATLALQEMETPKASVNMNFNSSTHNTLNIGANAVKPGYVIDRRVDENAPYIFWNRGGPCSMLLPLEPKWIDHCKKDGRPYQFIDPKREDVFDKDVIEGEMVDVTPKEPPRRAAPPSVPLSPNPPGWEARDLPPEHHDPAANETAFFKPPKKG